MRFLFGSSCVLCGSWTHQPVSMCLPCQGDIAAIENACKGCGLPLEEASDACGQCLLSPMVVDYTYALSQYQTPIDHLITRLKFNNQLSHAAILGFLLANYVETKVDKNELPDVILPVPLHNNRLRKRGFNQSLEIARPVSKRMGIPIDYKFARRIKATKAQMDLNIDERKKNIKGCFEVNSALNYQHVVLVDDVVTTGSTTNELARMLKNSGIKKVGVWTVSKAENPSSKR